MDGERSMKRGGWREVDGEKWMEKEKKWMMEGWLKKLDGEIDGEVD
jgi:hypothetical protein